MSKQDKVCANCMYCVYDTCEYEQANGYKRHLYVGHNNKNTGCKACFTEEMWDAENIEN